MIHDAKPGSVRDVHELLAAPKPEPIDLDEYFRGRAEREAAGAESLLRRLRSPLRLVAHVAGVWLVSAMLAHDAVSIFEGSVWPQEWGATAFLACIGLGAAIGVAIAIFIDDREVA